MMVTILDFSLWRFCGASVVTVVVYHCSVALLPIVPWADDRGSLLDRIPFEAPACSWTSPEFAPAFREPPENRYVTGAGNVMASLRRDTRKMRGVLAHEGGLGG